MKKHCAFFTSLLATAALVGCWNDHGDPKYYDIDSYVVWYNRPKTIRLKPVLSSDGNSYGMSVYCNEFLWSGSPLSNAEDYRAACARYGDNGFNQRITTVPENGQWFPYGPCANADSYAEITVQTVKAWDTEHPDGSTLDEFVRFDGWSYYPFIESHYTFSEPKTHIVGRLDRISSDDLVMLGIGASSPNSGPFDPLEICRLYFDAPPERPGTYPITVTLTTDEGEVFEAKGEVIFD